MAELKGPRSRVPRCAAGHNVTNGAALPLNAPSLRDAVSSTLRWAYVPYERLPHPVGGTRGCPLMPANASTDAVGLHVYGDTGTVAERIQVAQLWGAWHGAWLTKQSAKTDAERALTMPAKLRNLTRCLEVQRMQPDAMMRRWHLRALPGPD